MSDNTCALYVVQLESELTFITKRNSKGHCGKPLITLTTGENVWDLREISLDYLFLYTCITLDTHLYLHFFSKAREKKIKKSEIYLGTFHKHEM